MAASTANNQLMEEINDQFLVCKICYDIYKNPKTLSCLHTFCAECLEKHQDAELERSYRYLLYSRAVTCPICRKKTDVPTGGIKRLPDNFLVANLSDVINRQKPSHKVPQCEICSSKRGSSNSAVTKTSSDRESSSKAAVSKCLDCCKLLCRKCVELHRNTKVTQSHGLFDIEVEKDIICKFHADEVVRFYCEPCEVCVCVLCTFQEHKGHEVSSFTEGIEKYRSSLDSLLVICRGRITQLKDQLHLISRCEQDMKHTEEQIRDMAIESISAIRKKEREMVRDLYLAYGEDTISFMKEKDFIQESVESLQSTCNLTDIILKDKSIELLLLKKEIQEKLNILLQRKWQTPPANVTQEIHFNPGKPEFGYLQVGPELPDEVSNTNSLNHKSELNSASVDTQTETSQCDMATTMGKMVQDDYNEQLTQTEIIIRKETGTLTMPYQSKPVMKTQGSHVMPDVRDRHTMTASTPTMKRKIQTDSIQQINQETSMHSTKTFTTGLSANNQSLDTTDRGTMTKIRKLNDQTTATIGLITTQDHDTLTDTVRTVSSGTETTQQPMYNKGTLTNTPYTADKITSTARIILASQQTNTPVVRQMDFGVHAKMYGTDACVATRTTVTTHTGTGDQNVDVADKGVDTPWEITLKETVDKGTLYECGVKNESCMTDKPEVGHCSTYTHFFNMVDTSVETDCLSQLSTETNTDNVCLTNTCTNTDLIQHKDQSISAEFKTEKIDSFDEICQTMISLIDVVLWPSMMPVDKETNTDVSMCTDVASGNTQQEFANVGMNTSFHGMTSTGVGDNLCQTFDRSSSMSDLHLPSTRPQLKEQWCSTEQLVTTDIGITTETLELKDAIVDCCPITMSTAETNTEKVIIKPFVEMRDTASNTPVVSMGDAEINVKPITADMQSDPIQINFVSSTTNTESIKVQDADTTMHSVAHVQDNYVSTLEISNTSVGCCTTPLMTSECGISTETPSLSTTFTETNNANMEDKATGAEAVNTCDYGMVTSVETNDKGMRTDSMEMVHQETFMDKPFQSDAAVGTLEQVLQHKSTETDMKSTKTVGCYTFVQNLEKATYMPQPITVTAGTSTPEVHTFNKTVSTDEVELSDRSSNTVPIRTCSQETTMESNALTYDMCTGTISVEVKDKQTDSLHFANNSCGTNTPHTEWQDAETATKEVITLSSGTTTNHRVAYEDIYTETLSQQTKDKETATTVIVKQDKCILTRPEIKSVGLLKRPHTVTRGTGTVQIQMRTSATSPNDRLSAEQCTMTPIITTEDKAINCKPFDQQHKSSSTPVVIMAETASETNTQDLSERGSSPIRSLCTDRASSPIIFPFCERQTSPIPVQKSDKALTVQPSTDDMHTSTIQIELQSTGTEMPHIDTCDRPCSPFEQQLDKVTLHRGTSMPQIETRDVEMATVNEMTNTGVNTNTQCLVERGCTPIRQSIHDQGINVSVETTTKATGTPKTITHDKGLYFRPRTMNSFTEMPHQSFVEKETCTAQIHTLHKNIETENLNMVDKFTNTTDVTAIYRDLVAPSRAITVNRGTSMGHAQMVSKETSPPPRVFSTERASSPVKNMMVDKSVLVTKGELMEPMDTYHSAGGKKKPLKPIANRPQSSLTCITEDGESSQDDEPPQKDARLMSLNKLPKLAPRPRLAVSGLTHRERLWHATPRMGKSAVTAFSIEGRPSISSIMCTVEMGTNTSDVSLQTKSTSTLSIGMADKAVSTESLPVETKMAECISKLKTVRQRLEQKQNGVYVQAPGQESCQTATTSSSDIRRENSKVLLSLNMRSKSFGSKIDEDDDASFTAATATAKSSSSDRNSSSDESDSSGSRARGRLARKQRLDITQLLRSASLPEQENPPKTQPVLPKPKIQTLHTHVIPKFDVADIKSKIKKDLTKRPDARSLGTASPDRSPPKVPPRRRTPIGTDLSKKSKEPAMSSGTDPSKKSKDPAMSSGTDPSKKSKEPAVSSKDRPPEPPQRSTSLRQTLLGIKGLQFARRKDGSPAKK